MQSFRTLLVTTFITLAFAFTGCSDSGGNPTGPGNNTTIRAHWQGADGIGQLFSQMCTPCHTSQTQGGLNVLSYNGLFVNPDVTAGDPVNSYLIKKLTGDPAAGDRMPRGGPFLTTVQIDSIKVWIQAGALDN